MKYIGLHPEAFEYCVSDTLEGLAKEFEKDHDLYSLAGVDVYELPDRPLNVRIGYHIIKD